MLYSIIYDVTPTETDIEAKRRVALGIDGVHDQFAELCADRFVAGDAVRAVQQLGTIGEAGSSITLPDGGVFSIRPRVIEGLREWTYDILGFGTSVSDEEVVAAYNAYRARVEAS